MERKGLIFVLLVSTFLFGQIQPVEESGPKEGIFETGTLMYIGKNFVVIDESIFPLADNVQVTDVLGNRIPIMIIKLPALCKFQTNLMKGKESNVVKVVKLIILKSIKQTEFRKYQLKAK